MKHKAIDGLRKWASVIGEDAERLVIEFDEKVKELDLHPYSSEYQSMKAETLIQLGRLWGRREAEDESFLK